VLQRPNRVQNVAKSVQNFGQTKMAWEKSVLNGFWPPEFEFEVAIKIPDPRMELLILLVRNCTRKFPKIFRTSHTWGLLSLLPRRHVAMHKSLSETLFEYINIFTNLFLLSVEMYRQNCLVGPACQSWPFVLYKLVQDATRKV
jgi:hypothetical protein